MMLKKWEDGLSPQVVKIICKCGQKFTCLREFNEHRAVLPRNQHGIADIEYVGELK